MSDRVDGDGGSLRRFGLRVWVVGVDEMVEGACCWAAYCALSWFGILAWTSSVFATLMFGFGIASGSGLCCSEPGTYPFLARYGSVKHRSMVSSRGFC